MDRMTGGQHEKRPTPPKLRIGRRILLIPTGVGTLTPSQAARLGLAATAHDLLLAIQNDGRPVTLVARDLGIVELVRGIKSIKADEVIDLAASLFPWAVDGYPEQWPEQPTLTCLTSPA